MSLFAVGSADLRELLSQSVDAQGMIEKNAYPEISVTL